MTRLATTLFTAALLANLLHCEADTGGGLGEVYVGVQNEAAATGAEVSQFETRYGYQVTLLEARVWLGPLYVWAPSGAQASSPPLSLIGRAYAHGGYDPLSGRRIRVEYASQWAMDLLATEALSLGLQTAEIGTSDGASLALLPPPTGEGASTHGHHLWVHGVARKDGQDTEFAGGVDIADDGLLRRVNGIEAALELQDGRAVVLHVRTNVLFDRAHFDRLSDSDDDGVAELLPNSQPYDAIFLGLTDPDAYYVTIENE